jgi:hypothetical protein
MWRRLRFHCGPTFTVLLLDLGWLLRSNRVPMPSIDTLDSKGASNPHFLSPSSQKLPLDSQNLSVRRSSASLRGSSSAQLAEEDAANGRHSLAHELAVALMPEPSVGSKLLAEEFGIEYDEGAEGIDGQRHDRQENQDDGTSFAAGMRSQPFAYEDGRVPSLMDAPEPSDDDFPFKLTTQPERDAMNVLAQNMESTDKFLSHLRHLDVDTGSSVAQPALEKIAFDVIRRINDTSRDREGQLRALLEYEREFRRIAGEVGGSDVLGQLDELTGVEELSEEIPLAQASKVNVRLETVEEEVPNSPSEWGINADQHHHHHDPGGLEAEVLTPTRSSFAPPPLFHGPPTPSKTIPQLADLRTFTSSLVVSLTTISEQAQVNGAATTEAGRKLRALRNKLGEWRMDWDSAEISRLKIERWEAGIDDEEPLGGIPRSLNQGSINRRVDGRKIVQEHLQAFERALAEAAVRTKSITRLRHEPCSPHGA